MWEAEYHFLDICACRDFFFGETRKRTAGARLE